MTQFDKDYEMGKQSEKDSLKDLETIFGCKLTHDPEVFAHFDYFNDDILVELKTRPNTEWIDGQMKHTTKTGKVLYIDTLYFDAPKMRFAFQQNKKLRLQGKPEKKHFIVWKCSGTYFYWQINWKGEQGNREDYYVEEQDRDFGHGYNQVRDVINVYIKKMTIFS